MPVTVPAFTTAARILTLVGDLGVDLRLDDSPDADAALDAAVEAGTQDVWFFLSAYDPTELSQSVWTQLHATWFAVRYLCQRRLNDLPKSVADECERREKQLQMVLERKVDAPGVAKTRRGGAVTNYDTDLRRWNVQVRVNRPKSTGVAKGYIRPTAPDAVDDRQ
jgi:hypothetical protein